MITCDVEEHVPIPTGTTASYYTVREKARAACHAAKVLLVQGYEDPRADNKKLNNHIKHVVESVAKNMEPNPLTLSTALASTEGAIRTNNILQEFDMAVVQDAKRLRNYVTNKLIIESENMDARIRIKALELLGKISDVGLFTERTEVTLNNKSTLELESTLKDKLRRLMGKEDAQDAEIITEPVQPVRRIAVSDELEGL